MTNEIQYFYNNNFADTKIRIDTLIFDPGEETIRAWNLQRSHKHRRERTQWTSNYMTTDEASNRRIWYMVEISKKRIGQSGCYACTILTVSLCHKSMNLNLAQIISTSKILSLTLSC